MLLKPIIRGVTGSVGTCKSVSSSRVRARGATFEFDHQIFMAPSLHCRAHQIFINVLVVVVVRVAVVVVVVTVFIELGRTGQAAAQELVSVSVHANWLAQSRELRKNLMKNSLKCPFFH